MKAFLTKFIQSNLTAEFCCFCIVQKRKVVDKISLVTSCDIFKFFGGKKCQYNNEIDQAAVILSAYLLCPNRERKGKISGECEHTKSQKL